MKISKLIAKLQAEQDRLGDVEVLITDGFEYNFYRGDYEITEYQDDDGSMTVDIGIGGCKE